MNDARRNGKKPRLSRAATAIRAAFGQVWERFVLFSHVHGWRLPGIEKARARLNEEHLAALDRQILVREIKGSRLLVRKGPLWVRQSGETLLRFVQRNRVFLSAFFKLVVGLLCIVLPVGIFVLVRGVLPVPSRIPFEEPASRLPRHSNIDVEWPYTSGPYSAAGGETLTLTNEGDFRGGEILSVREPGAPAGLFRIMVGDYPTRADGFRGFLVTEHFPGRVLRQHARPVDLAGRNRLLIWHYLFPTLKGQERCRLEIRNEHGEMLLSTESEAPRLARASRGAFRRQLQERLTPGQAVETGRLREFVLETDTPPSEFRMKVSRLDTDVPSEPSVAPDASTEACVYAVGQFQFETERVARSGRRGTVFVVVDSLRRRLAYDAGLMPELDAFWKNGGMRFERHFSQGTNSTLSMSSLLTSRYARELVSPSRALDEDLLPSLGSVTSLPQVVQALGYRTAAIGRLSEEDASVWQETVSIENRHYETRSITEEAGRWLERSGSAPFFLYLHYGTFRPPFRPPFSEVHPWRFFSSPVGYGIEEDLERGLARTWDGEFGLLMRKLELLGLDDAVDVVVTSDHGVQMSEMEYGRIPGLPSTLVGAARSRGPVTEDEVHVPLFVRPARDLRTEARKVDKVTTHLDLAPTLVRLLEGKVPSSWRGRLLPPVASEDSLSTTGFAYAEGPVMAAVVDVDTRGAQTKYIRQFAPFDAVVFQRRLPWRTPVRWFEPELFSLVSPRGEEEWTSILPPERIENLRRMFFAEAPLWRVLRFEPRFEGAWVLPLVLRLADERIGERPPPVADLARTAPGVTAQWRQFSDRWEVVLRGDVSRGVPSYVLVPPGSAIVVSDGIDFTFEGCPQALSFGAREASRLLSAPSCLEGKPPIREQSGERTVMIQILAGVHEFP